MKLSPLSFAFFAFASIASAQVTFYYDRASFLADSRITSATFANENFDSYSPGTDLTNAVVSGATLSAPSSGPLQVILGSTGVRFALSPSSGLNVLSPGGSNAGLEDDDLAITFASPVQAAGLDVVFDVPDGASFTGVYFYDNANNLIASNSSIPCPSGAPGYQFVGLVGDFAQISKIVFDEYDPTASDDNIAYDSLTFTAIPEPTTTAMLFAFSAIGFAAYRRRRRLSA